VSVQAETLTGKAFDPVARDCVSDFFCHGDTKARPVLLAGMKNSKKMLVMEPLADF